MKNPVSLLLLWAFFSNLAFSQEIAPRPTPDFYPHYVEKYNRKSQVKKMTIKSEEDVSLPKTKSWERP